MEGRDSDARDVARAMGSGYSADPQRRVLQHEARAHIDVQRMIDFGESPREPISSLGYVSWLHHEFCRRLPEDLLWVKNPDTGERVRVVPGELRRVAVKLGQHVPPGPEHLEALLHRLN